MQNSYKISIPKDLYEKLEKLSELLKISIQEIVQLAIKELFDLIKNDSEIFLERLGIIKNLKEIVKT